MSTRRLRIGFVGDLSFSFLRRSQSHISDFSDNWNVIRRAIGEYDLLVGNLECYVVNSGCSEKIRRQSMAVSGDAIRPFLDAMGFSVLGLANNHSIDGGQEGLEATLERLASLQIHTFGAGRSVAEAEKATFVEVNGHRIAFVGACDNREHYAKADLRGIAPLVPQRLGSRVRRAASQADVVIVVIHADLEFSDVPGRWRRRLSRWLVEQGAHMVIQHHPHVLQGIEVHEGGLIAYSLGNFVFPIEGNRYQERHAGVRNTMVLVTDVRFGNGAPEIGYQIVPVRIGDDHFPKLLTGSKATSAMEDVSRLTSILEDKNSYRLAWLRRCKQEAIARARSIYYAFAKGQYARGISEIWSILSRQQDRRWIMGLLSIGYV